MEKTGQKSVDQDADSIHKKRDAIWPLVLFYIHLNILGVYGIYVLFASATWPTILFSECQGLISVQCITNWLTFALFLNVNFHIFSKCPNALWNLGCDCGCSPAVGPQDLHRLKTPEGFPHALSDNRGTGELILPLKLLPTTQLLKLKLKY